jgi:hypothetical protein
MSANLERLKAKVAGANARFSANVCSILEPGDYRFTIKTASFERDEKRDYEYLFVTMPCNGERLTSDRFQLTDDWLWKLGTLLAAVGIEINAWTGEKELIGLTGSLTAEAKGKWTVYRYHSAGS